MIRLLKKEDIVAIRAKERKQELDEGLKVAKRVDNLRQTLAEEEAGLGRFRSETVKTIQKEIDDLIIKKQKIASEVDRLEKERIRELPIAEVVRKWEQKVENDKKKNEDWITGLLDREAKVILKESSLENTKRELFAKEEALKETKQLSENYLKETKKNYELSEKIRFEADAQRKKILKELELKSLKLNTEEQLLASKEKDIRNRELEYEKNKKEFNDQKIHIQSQQETLRVAWEQIQRLKK